jgi:hypothetical protein
VTEIVARCARYFGALALLAVGVDHLEQYFVDSYSVVPVIGTLFVLNFGSAAVIAAGLGAPVERLPGRAGRLALPLLSLSGIGVAAGSIAGLLVSESSGLFGFMEAGYRPTIVLSLALEATVVALLGLYLALMLSSSSAARGGPPQAASSFRSSPARRA